MTTRLAAEPFPYRKTPAYPTKLAVTFAPALLERHRPPAWLANSELVYAAGALLIAGATGCGGSAHPSPSRRELATGSPAVVAPLFVHGEGRGATGCVALSPPVFLSEEEALQVIRDELAQNGIDITQENVELDSVCVPRRYIEIELASDSSELRTKISEVVEERQVLAVDLVDSEHQIMIEFVSHTDYRDLGGPCYGHGDWSSVNEYDFCETAAFLNEQVRSQAAGVYFGAFYDPLVGPGRFVKWADRRDEPCTSVDEMVERVVGEYNDRESLATEESKRLLRMQVQDFVQWLKAQGAI